MKTVAPTITGISITITSISTRDTFARERPKCSRNSYPGTPGTRVPRSQEAMDGSRNSQGVMTTDSLLFPAPEGGVHTYPGYPGTPGGTRVGIFGIRVPRVPNQNPLGTQEFTAGS
eukprot:803793-Rhodomonas_salina.1